MTESKVERARGPDPDMDTLSRIQSLLGDTAAQEFVPLWQQWVSSGYISGRYFNAAGDKMVAASIEPGGLQPEHSVLDVGCGIGRNTLPLLKYVSPAGSYEGFDVTASGIRWLQRYVTAKFPHFRFQLAAGIYSGLYNPAGDQDASCYDFPYSEGSFDFAIAVSVFTHMAPFAVSHYLSEIARVLKPGGRLMCTIYLLDDEALAMVQAGKSAIGFSNDFGAYRLQNASLPEFAIAFDEKYFLHCAAEAGLHLKGGVQRGSWRNEGIHTGQDLVVLESEHKAS